MVVSNGVGADTSHLYMQIATVDDGFDLYRDESDLHQKPSCIRSIVESATFQMSIGLIIAANAAVIGLETDVEDFQWLWAELEDVFLLIFLLELLLRICAYGCWGFFGSSHADFHWNVFDFTIVTLGSTDRLLSHLQKHSGSGGSGARFFVLLMRTFRLLRILRIIRIFRLMKQLYLLANSMIEAFQAVAWVSMLVVMILYVCAIVITRLVGQPETDEDEEGESLDKFRVEHFGSVKTSMLTLFRLMAFPDMEAFKPVYAAFPSFELFLVGFIIFGSFAIVSLLTGVICESMIEKSRRREDERRFDRERNRRFLAEDLRQLFKEKDVQGSGGMSRCQFEQCKEQVIHLCAAHSVRLRNQDLDALYELVDDGSGVIDSEELLYGMLQLNSEVRPMAIMELRRLVVRGLHNVSEQVAAMDARQQMMDRRMIELQAAARFGALAAPAATENGGVDKGYVVTASPPLVDLLGTGMH